MIAVILIATGREEFIRFIEPAIAALKAFFPPHDVILFTDSDIVFDAVKFYEPSRGWPRVTLMRYHTTLTQEKLLLKYDHIFYIDADMLVMRKIEPTEILSAGLTAVLHPGFIQGFERRRESTACILGSATYYQGCFVGGATKPFLEMCRTIKTNIDIDDSKGLAAIWFDESHLNRYLLNNPPTITLSPAWCWPEDGEYYLQFLNKWPNPDTKNFAPVIKHLDKPGQKVWKGLL